MSDANPLPADDELKQAMAAAFGDDAMDLLDDDDLGELSPELLAAFGDEVQPEFDPLRTSDETVSSVSSLKRIELDDDASPLMRFVQDLNNAIYIDRRSSGRGADETGSATSSNSKQYVIGAIGEQQFAIPLAEVREIARTPMVTPLPRTPAWLRGICNLRGQILSVTDLRILIDHASEQPAVGEKVIIVHCPQHASSTAIVFDRVLGIRNLNVTDSPFDVADLGPRIEMIAGAIAPFDQAPTVLIDSNKLLGCEELQAFAS